MGPGSGINPDLDPGPRAGRDRHPLSHALTSTPRSTAFPTRRSRSRH